MGRPRASPVSLRMRICAASAISNYCVHVNYYCLRKQLALVRISQALKQLIVTLRDRSYLFGTLGAEGSLSKEILDVL